MFQLLHTLAVGKSLWCHNEALWWWDIHNHLLSLFFKHRNNVILPPTKAKPDSSLLHPNNLHLSIAIFLYLTVHCMTILFQGTSLAGSCRAPGSEPQE